jgi:hypothetical protein
MVKMSHTKSQACISSIGKFVGKIFVELESDFWRWYIWMTAVVVHNYA